MEYYILVSSINSKIVGRDFPQAWKFTKEYQKKSDDPNGIYAFIKCVRHRNVRPDFIPDLGGFKLSSIAKITDIISTGVFSILAMNQRTADIFSQFNLGDHEFYKWTLYTKNGEFDYFYLCSFTEIFNSVIIPESIFKMCMALGSENHALWLNGFSSYKAYNDFVNKMHSWDKTPVYLSMKEDFDFGLDFFIIDELNVFLGIISERLKTRLDEEGVTGLEYVPVEIAVKNKSGNN